MGHGARGLQSADGTAWEYFPHDHARSRAYRWGEDGIGGICDRHQRICFALALWNGRDPILKERLFGLTGNEGNHGEDVKEYYFYLDSTPDAFLHEVCSTNIRRRSFPTTQLVEENRRRTKADPEFELLDTGMFDENRYFDVFVEYAKAAARRHSDSRSRRGIAGRKRRRSICCRRSGFAISGRWGRSTGMPQLCARRRISRARVVIGAGKRVYGQALADGGRRAGIAFHRERNQFRAPLRLCESHRPYVKDAFTNI